MSWNKRYFGGGAGEQRPFNFAQLFLERCSKLFEAANEASVEGEYARWYRVLGSIRRAISFTSALSEQTKKDLEKLKGDIGSLRGKIRTALKTKQEAFYYEIESDLEEIEVKIIEIMYTHELYYPKYNKKTWQEKAKDEPT